MITDLTDEEVGTLIKLVRRTIEEDRFTLSPRLDPLKAILAKLEPPPKSRKYEPPPPLKPGMGPSHGRGRPRR
jgi:hypothetical protein